MLIMSPEEKASAHPLNTLHLSREIVTQLTFSLRGRGVGVAIYFVECKHKGQVSNRPKKKSEKFFLSLLFGCLVWGGEVVQRLLL